MMILEEVIAKIIKKLNSHEGTQGQGKKVLELKKPLCSSNLYFCDSLIEIK